MSGVSRKERDQIELLVRVGATENHPAFVVDFGEINVRTASALVKRGLLGKASLRRYSRYGGEHIRVGYWPTKAGLSVLDGAAE